MREYKFKIWDKAKKCWLTDRERCLIDEDGYIFIEVNSYAGAYLQRVEGEIVWFTGLKDKNEKEIYDGDFICRYTGYTFEVKVREYRLGEINQAKAYGYDWHQSDEIIGNIHENPELIKK